MWVFITPSTHKTTHKKLRRGFDALTPDVRSILADEMQGGGFSSYLFYNSEKLEFVAYT
jgi:hypothetical protein